MIGRRAFLGSALAAGAVLRAKAAPLTYRLTPEKVADGLWCVRGADAPIAAANGGAIANITLIATSDGPVLIDAGPTLRYGRALAELARRLTGKPVARVYLTHLHPDHTYGDNAFPPDRLAATPALIASLKSDGNQFSDGMYRLLGDWMRGTELALPGHSITAERETVGGRTLRMLPLSGHSAADLAVLDEMTGTLISGDLVFHNRAPSTPHADIATWRRSLATLKALGHQRSIPGHGPVDPTPATAIDQTRSWLDWLEETLTQAAAGGLSAAEAGALPIPVAFAGMAAARYEFERSIVHFYAGLQERLLPRVDQAKRD